MSHQEDLGTFLKSGKTLLADYLQTQVEIYRLRGVRALSKTAGYLIWIIICLLLISLIVIFSGIVLGLWLSQLTGSPVVGFGYVTAGYLLIMIILTAFRKAIFVNPIIRLVLKQSRDPYENEDAETEND